MKLKVLFLVWVIIAAFMLLMACGKTNEPGTRYKIDFGAVGDDHWDISNVKMEYDDNVLEKKISGKTAYIYGSSKIENYDDIAGQFGFTAVQILPAVDDVVEYQDISDDRIRRLFIWPTGKIRYDTGVKETSFETKVNQNDCVEISKQVLEQYGLTSHMFDSEWNYSESRLTDPQDNKTTVIGYTVFLHFLLDGTSLYGEPRVTVKFNGNGEVVSIMYNMPDYVKGDVASIKSVSRILQSIQRGEVPVMYDLDSIPDRITIEDVELCYYSQTFEENVAIAQPIYVFNSVGHYENEEVPFRIVAQAN
ncbi:MAG: hypothetical protein J6T65_00825 [Clostridia bacterium]|nr:hypothetical protein [Clostridia bacterium]